MVAGVLVPSVPSYLMLCAFLPNAHLLRDGGWRRGGLSKDRGLALVSQSQFPWDLVTSLQIVTSQSATMERLEMGIGAVHKESFCSQKECL